MYRHPHTPLLKTFTVGRSSVVILTIRNWHEIKPFSGLLAGLALNCWKDTLPNPLKGQISLKSHWRLHFKWLGPCLHSTGLHIKHLRCGTTCCLNDSGAPAPWNRKLSENGLSRAQSSDPATFMFSSRAWEHAAFGCATFSQSNGNAHATIADDPAAFVLLAMQQAYCEQRSSMILGVFVQTWRIQCLEINFFVVFI